MSKQIKSSIELAMERAAKLPKLTKQQIRERQEKEYGPLGASLARRLLTGGLSEAGLQAELFRLQDERGEIVRKAFAASLCQSIDLDDAEAMDKVLGAIEALVPDGYPEAAARRLRDILRNYERQKQQELAAVEREDGACLRALGVSGSAIRPGPRENERWRRRASELKRACDQEAEEIRRELGGHLVAGLHGRP